ncbi:FAD-dependent oxidoreductase [Leucobacter luti]|uniref:Pyridine nucleotide-disulfide oxidoreductase n=1 Tax=Leucobacter luti TaxID=340320 RepID=A0A4Q7TK72_9MICO|nr:FAD-dependent oxidoreductase [Leucobacter luti]MBL3700271.1 FAD-dependent oxidoreductase [Leucobacter luti]RZT61005.1 pyridine nucleotide-disulfide oxidoreductase [Leucobacter luti]
MRTVVVIGAGPQGLAAAAHLLERGLEPLVCEQGPGPGSSVAEWGHVRLFSPWSELVDPAAARLLSASGWVPPATGFPTGRQWIEQYLAPLAALLRERIMYGARVTGVARLGRDLTVDEGRPTQPFVVHAVTEQSEEHRVLARAVIDASGTWLTPNPAGAEGIPAIGEARARAHGLVVHRIPDSDEVNALAGQHVVVVGNGHSAATAITLLGRVVQRDPATRVTWVVRRGTVGNALGGGSGDELPERGALGQRAKQLVADGRVSLVTGFRTERCATEGSDVVLHAGDGRALEPASRVFVLTGFRPDLGFLSEVRLGLDPRLQAPSRVASEVDPNAHSCGSIRATGAADLAHPDPGFYVVGAKSYGRAPTFLAVTGFEQVRSVVAEIAGDRAGAERVELVLPDTGVCGGSGLFDAPGDAGRPRSPGRV